MLRSAGRDDVLVEETIPLTDDDDYTDDDDDDEGNTSVVSLGIEKKKKKKLKSSSSSSSTPRRRGYNDNHHHNDNYSYNTNDKDDDDDDDDVNAKLKKQLHHHWNIVSKTVREKVKKMDKDHMKFIALVVFVLMVMMQMSRSSRPPPSPPVSKRLRTSSSSSSSNAEMEPKKRINHNNNNDDDDTRDPTMAMASKNRDNLSKSDSLESLMSKQTTTKPSFMQPGLMQQQGFQTQQQMLQQQQQQQQALLQQGFMPQQQPGGFGQTMTPGLAGQPQQQGFPQMGMMTQDPQQTGLQQQQPGFHQQQGDIMMMQPQQQPGMMQQGGLLPQNPGGMTMQPQDAMLQQQQQQQQPGMMQPQNGMMQQQPQQQMGMLQQPGMMQPQQQQQGTMMMQGMGQQPPGMMQQQQQPLMQQQPGMNMMQQQPGLMMQGMPQQQPLVTTPMDTSMGGNAMMQPQQQQAGAAGMATTQMPLAAAATDGAAAGTSVDRPSDADMEKVSQEIPLQTLVNFKETWGPYDIKDVPIFWHIPKAGGSTVKDVIGSCHRHTMATEFGVTDGHDQDKEIAVVYPRVPGAEAEDRSPFVNVDTTTVAGIQRANAMGFADSGLAGCVVTPFLYEANDLFTPTARGRLFSVFRHPVDRAISMFYYIQVATWEPTYKPELQSWTLEQYATSDVVENNWMVRQLSNTLGGDLDDGHLKTAMEVIRRKFLVGIMKKLEASMTRFEKFFRWKYHVNPTNQEVCRERLTSGGSNSNSQNKKSKPKPGEPVWEMLAAQNVYDMQLYEYIETLFEEQEAFVTGMPDDFRKIDATCCKCDPPTFPPEGFNCPKKVLNSDG